MTTPPAPQARGGFKIAIICAVKVEAESVLAMFDKWWEDEGKRYGKAAGDKNTYNTGVIGRYNVVLVLLPRMGSVPAAQAAASLGMSYPNVKLVLVVGVCGVVPINPDTKEEIILGDVIISTAVTQYDFGRQYPGGYVRKTSIEDSLRKAPKEIQGLLNNLDVRQNRRRFRADLIRLVSSTQLLQAEPTAIYPGATQDRLYEALYLHQHRPPVACGKCHESSDAICSVYCDELGCETDKLIARERLSKLQRPSPSTHAGDGPLIHLGRMGSANTVMKSGADRDVLAAREKLIAFEMEGAGVWDEHPTVIIKAACDYADSHKHKAWQPYAAMMAAGCLKVMLGNWIDSEELAESDALKALGFYSASTLAVAPEEQITHCNTLPFPRNPSFHGREDVIEVIGRYLGRSDNRTGIRSVAIWGMGGVGKTQIALEFANRQLEDGTSTIIWIESETEAKVTASFDRAAVSLQLPDYKTTNTPSQNRLSVLQWLQKTKQPWLLIFDNAEKDQVLTDSWPIVGDGCILVTCRSEIIADSRPAVAIEIYPFSTSESSALILRILNREDVSRHEVEASRELSAILGGLALALDMIAKQVRMRKKSIRDFIPYYKRYYASLHRRPRDVVDQYYEKDLVTVWEAAFQNLSRTAATLMSLLCFLSPEDVPHWLLTQDIDSDANYWFLCEPGKFEDAKLELLHLSLIRINDETGSISVHRLVQTAYYDRMERTTRIATLKATYALLRRAFPHRSMNGDLYTHWELCRELVQHVLAWQARYDPPSRRGWIEISPDATVLIMDLARCLQESGRSIACEDIIRPYVESYPDEKPMVYACVCIEAGTLFDRTGRSVRALPAYRKAYEILLAKFVESHPSSNDMANGYDLMNLACFGIAQGEAALEWIDKAINCMTQQNISDEEIARAYDADRFWRNRARTNYLLKRYDTAIDDVRQAEKYQLLMYGKDSHYDGESAYIFAKIYYRTRQWQEATEQVQRACRLLAPSKPKHAFVIATRFLQAIILMAQSEQEQGPDSSTKDDEALIYLEAALVMCAFNERWRGNRGEVARVEWRMSQLYERFGDSTQAQYFRESALDIKLSLQSTGDYYIPEDEEESWNALVGSVYR